MNKTGYFCIGIIFVFHIILKYNFLNSWLLIDDDLYYISKALNAKKLWTLVPGSEIPYLFFFYSIKVFQKVIINKLFYIALIALSYIPLSKILYYFAPNSKYIPIITVLSLILPHTSAVGIEVIGGHTTFSFFMFLWGFKFFLDSISMQSERIFSKKYIYCILLTLFAATFSSTVILTAAMPLYYLLYFKNNRTFNKDIQAALPLLSVGFLCLGLRFFRDALNEYDGFVQSSFEGFLYQIYTLYLRSIRFYISPNKIILYLTLITVVGFILMSLYKIIRNKEKNNNKLYFFLISCFLFAQTPYILLNYTSPRHFVVPMLFFTLLFLLIVSVNFSKKSFYFLAVVLFLNSSNGLFRNYGHQLKTLTLIKNFVSQESASWPFKSQIILELPEKFPSPSHGFSHYSQTYLNLLTGRKDLTGIIGNANHMIHYPFTEFNAPHAEYNMYEYTDDKGRKLIRRKKMFGIISNLPTFGYRIKSPSNNISIVNEIIINYPKDNKTEYYLLCPGKPFIKKDNKSQSCPVNELTKDIMGDPFIFNVDSATNKNLEKTIIFN